jgi:DNA repair protein RadC
MDTLDLAEGTVNSSAVSPRDVIEGAIRSNSVGLIFVHNHPSGNPEPSASDKGLTRELVYAGNLLRLRVLDHIIIGDNRYFSFAGEGLIEAYETDFLNIMLKGIAESRRRTYQTGSSPDNIYRQQR